MVLSQKAFVYKNEASAERPGIKYLSFPGEKATSKTPSLTASSPSSSGHGRAATPPSAPAQQDGATALLIDTTNKRDWSEEMVSR